MVRPTTYFMIFYFHPDGPYNIWDPDAKNDSPFISLSDAKKQSIKDSSKLKKTNGFWPWIKIAKFVDGVGYTDKHLGVRKNDKVVWSKMR